MRSLYVKLKDFSESYHLVNSRGKRTRIPVFPQCRTSLRNGTNRSGYCDFGQPFLGALFQVKDAGDEFDVFQGEGQFSSCD